jgi:hypothetical protein
LSAAPNPTVVDKRSASRRVRMTESFDFAMDGNSSRDLHAIASFDIALLN